MSADSDPSSMSGDSIECPLGSGEECTFVADVLAETESVTREIQAQRETALRAWQAQLRHLRVLSEEGNQLTPSAFVRRINALIPKLQEAAAAAIVYTHLAGRIED